GVEVTPGTSLKVKPEIGTLIHISHIALSEVKDLKKAQYVPLRLKIDDKDYIIGSLSAEDRTQIMVDLVFEKEFELSHDLKDGSIYFIGYKAEDPISDDDEFSSEDFSDEDDDEHVEANNELDEAPKDINSNALKSESKKVDLPATDKASDSSDSDGKIDDESEDDDDDDDDDEMKLDGVSGDSEDLTD
ncbi:deacetylase-like protein, partial [Genlisea aurea]